MGGGKVTPITLFDDNGNQSENDEEDEDDDMKKNRESSESSFYLGKEIISVTFHVGSEFSLKVSGGVVP